MKPSALEFILDAALAHGEHHRDCKFRLSKSYLPRRHPRFAAAVNIDQCDCWKKKATRMLRALRVVKAS